MKIIKIKSVVCLIFSCLLFESCASGTGNEITYLYENDTIRQIVKIVAMNEDSIIFRFVSENKKHIQKVEIDGVAFNRNVGLDPEIIEDEDGFAYAANEYTYAASCYLWFFIELENQSIMTIGAANCKINNPHCPVYSAGILKRQIK